MTLKEHKKIYENLKKEFLSGNLSEIPPNYAAVIRDWNESLEAGANPHQQILGGEARDYAVFDRLDDLYKCHITYFDQYYESRTKTLNELGCAIFYLDNEFTVYQKGGNSDFLKLLKSRGIRIGTNLSPKNIGIFAGNIAPRFPNINVVSIGAAHFSNVLNDIVCVARYGESPEIATFKANNVIMIPIAQYSKNIRTTVSFLLESEDYSYKRSPMYPHIRQKFELLERSAQYDSDILFLVDKSGQMVFINNKFEKEFGIYTRKCIGNPLEQVLPSLQDVDRCLKSGKNLTAKEIMLPDAQGVGRFYYMDLIVMKENREILGAKITLQPAKKRNIITSNYVGNISYFTFDDIIGESSAMLYAKQYGMRAAQHDSTVLITGESGTGKELFAHSIHSASKRANAPFIPINCVAIPRELIGTELFGYEGGSFTGANKDGAPGKIELAEGGTLFLDEIGEMPLDMQAFLLRFLEDGVVNRIGSKKYQNMDVRIISATNQNLVECVAAGTFRLDLYYRLNVMHLELPALREHMEDLPLLINHFIATLSPKYNKNIPSISNSSLNLMRKYSWPGNIRQLRNIIERSIVSTEDGKPLTLDFETAEKMKSETIERISLQYMDSNKQIPNYQTHEEQTLRSLMIEFRGNKSKVARALGISRGTLYKRLKEINYE